MGCGCMAGRAIFLGWGQGRRCGWEGRLGCLGMEWNKAGKFTLGPVL
jgi:hypothetical protein